MRFVEIKVMKFIEASKFGGPEVLTVVEAPASTPTEGTLLVEVRAAGVNYADIMARSGFYPRVPKAPFPVGFEIAGVVKNIGKDVESEGRLKLEIAKYPLSEAANVQRLFEARKTSRKLVLIPQN
jgi:hypothetical protein